MLARVKDKKIVKQCVAARQNKKESSAAKKPARHRKSKILELQGKAKQNQKNSFYAYFSLVIFSIALGVLGTKRNSRAIEKLIMIELYIFLQLLLRYFLLQV